MPRTVKLQPEDGDEYLPPTHYLKFSQEEFPDFLTNPTVTMKDLGHPVKNLTVTVKDHIWDARRQEWVTDQPHKSFEAPGSATWEWWCGYSDEMCVCYAVIVP
ncbi:hypothetical protein [Streptomyces pseudovenezuelae]|uniref:hypothetical protein n=1 Tax=Streptomyces pseudovenezuelae TaxID=67350 RepID=UPI002E800961|nr:hypothetical protein [Streptomyces pseudovenezuelae]WUA87500.1 hypothetical protein OHO81_09450 [Streptomyces pseudovenezuelae]